MSVASVIADITNLPDVLVTIIADYARATVEDFALRYILLRREQVTLDAYLVFAMRFSNKDDVKCNVLGCRALARAIVKLNFVYMLPTYVCAECWRDVEDELTKQILTGKDDHFIVGRE